MCDVADLRERLSADDCVIRFIVEDLCSLLGRSLRSLVENTCAGFNRSLNETFRADTIGFQFNAIVAIYSINLRFSECAASEDGDGLTRRKDLADHLLKPKVIEL